MIHDLLWIRIWQNDMDPTGYGTPTLLFVFQLFKNSIYLKVFFASGSRASVQCTGHNLCGVADPIHTNVNPYPGTNIYLYG